MIRIEHAAEVNGPSADEVMGMIASVWRDQLLAFARLGAGIGPAAARAASICLAWGQKYLPDHFSCPPSNMHRWLAEQIDAAQTARGTKINVLGPRGGAKSTIGTLALPLRAAVECSGELHLDRLRHQTPGVRPPGEHQGRIARKPPAGQGFSRRRRAGAGLARQLDRAAQRRDDRGVRHGPANPRPAPPPTSAHADRLRRPAKRRPHPLGRCSANIRAIGSTAR